MESKEHFKKLNAINVNSHTEKKQKLTYLSWAWAWAEAKKVYPDATYNILKFENNVPYVYDEKTGYMVFTQVTIDELTHEMWLPVMDGANKAMKSEPYTYQVAEWSNGRKTGNMIEKNVDAATMFDINKSIMRCLTKNLAMFGLGLYIYSGEDLPEINNEKPKKQEIKEQPKVQELETLNPNTAKWEEIKHYLCFGYEPKGGGEHKKMTMDDVKKKFKISKENEDIMNDQVTNQEIL